MAPKKQGKKKAPKSKRTSKKAKKAPKKVKAKGAKKTAPKSKAPKAAKPKAAKAKVELTMMIPKGTYLNKSELMNNFACTAGIAKKEARSALEALTKIGQNELQKRGKFVIPQMARFIVRKKKATKARKGINPFTKEECMFKAKPARKVVKAFVVKAFKEL